MNTSEIDAKGLAPRPKTGFGKKSLRGSAMPSVEVGDIFIVRCIEAGQDDWRRLKVAGAVPCPEGEKTSRYTVQIPGAEVETREVTREALLEECDREQ
jgi:hypothetical protein